jgi:hypothetical protein
MIVKKTIIEKIVSDVDWKMLDKCTIETQSLNDHQVIVGIPIVKRPLGDQGLKNCLTVAR